MLAVCILLSCSPAVLPEIDIGGTACPPGLTGPAELCVGKLLGCLQEERPLELSSLNCPALS